MLGVYREGYIQPISFSVTQYEENPVFLDSIYEIGGKKIAYLIYNFFALDRGDGSYAYLKELNDIFGRFKEVNPDELVLDLRYNTGGVVTAAVSLSSMISGRNSSDLFSISKYNSIVDKEFKKIYGDDYNKTFFDDFLIIRNEEDKIIDQSIPINKLSGLKRLYVLTSQSTASASELVINGLRPYMNVVLVGKTTRGKNTGMWFIYEDDPVKQKDNRWGLLPIVVKTYNSKNEGDFTNGIKADMEVNEYSADLFQLGDTRELLLGAALIDIGVRNASGLRRAEERFSDKPLISTGDLMQARGNLIVERF